MNRVVPFTDIENFSQVATDLSGLLSNGENEDISKEFPSTFNRYTVSHTEVMANLETAKSKIEVGEHEQFIIFAGERAVGLSVVTSRLDIPEAAEPASPNISYLVCNPYRGRGLGQLSLSTQMDTVRQNFHGHAWTFVRDDNDISEHMILKAGFEKTEIEVEGWAGHHLYLFDENA